MTIPRLGNLMLFFGFWCCQVIQIRQIISCFVVTSKIPPTSKQSFSIFSPMNEVFQLANSRKQMRMIASKDRGKETISHTHPFVRGCWLGDSCGPSTVWRQPGVELPRRPNARRGGHVLPGHRPLPPRKWFSLFQGAAAHCPPPPRGIGLKCPIIRFGQNSQH